MRKFIFCSIAIYLTPFSVPCQKIIPADYDSSIIYDIGDNAEKPEWKTVQEFSQGLLKKITNYKWDEKQNRWVFDTNETEKIYEYNKSGKLTSITTREIFYDYKKSGYDDTRIEDKWRLNYSYNDQGQLIKTEDEIHGDKKNDWNNFSRTYYGYEGGNIIKITRQSWMVIKMKKTTTLNNYIDYTYGGSRHTTISTTKGVKGVKDWATASTIYYKYEPNGKVTATDFHLDYKYYDNSLSYYEPTFLYHTDTSLTTKEKIMKNVPDVAGIISVNPESVRIEGNNVIVISKKEKKKRIYYYNHKVD